MQPYLEPLLPGQEFSFLDVVYAQWRKGSDESVFLPLRDLREFEKCQGRKVSISPKQRLIVQDEVGIGYGGWRVNTWLPGENCMMVFEQRVDVEGLRRRIDRSRWCYAERMEDSQVFTLEVANVGWPAPTPESLMVHVRCLSRWIGPAIDHKKNYDQILWEKCRQLQTLPLGKGVELALKWLREGKYVADPVAALRERGFDI